MTGEELRFSVIADTAQAEGLPSRMDAIFKKVADNSARADAAISARDQAQANRRVQLEERTIDRLTAATRGMHATFDRMDAEADAKLRSRTKARYAEMDRAAQNRQSALTNGLRLAGGGSSPSGGSGGGGHGHGGLGNARVMGDLLDGATGTSGWVMRMRALQVFGPAVAAAGAVAYGGFKIGQANYENLQSEDALRTAMGAGGERARFRGGFGTAAGALEGFGGSSRFLDVKSDARGAAGMSAQREALTAAIEDAEKKRGGFWHQVGTGFGGEYSDRALGRTLGSAYGMRGDIDQRSAGLVRAGTAASESRAYGGELAGGLAQSAVTLKAALAAAFDARRDGKMGEREYSAQTDAARSEDEIRRRDLTRGARARNRANVTSDDETYVRGRGEDVPQRLAAGRLSAAQSALNDAPDPESEAKARAEYNAAHQALVEAEKATRERKESLKVEQAIADFRGGAEARTLHSAEQNLAKEQALYSIAQERGADAEREAKVRVSSAELALSLTRQEVAEQRGARAAGVATGNVRLRSAAFGLGAQTNTANEGVAFAAGQSIAREQAAAGVRSAMIEATRANSNVAGEVNEQGQASEKSIAAQVAAVQAKLAQLATEKQLTFAAHERARTIGIEASAASRETAAMRLGNTGRDAEAGRLRVRGASDERIEDFLHRGRGDLARQEFLQQGEREFGQFRAEFLNPDGTTNRVGANEAERQRRQTAGRLERARGRLARDGGLINVRRDSWGHIQSGEDPLHREWGRIRPDDPRRNREADFARKQADAAKDAAKEAADAKQLQHDLLNAMNMIEQLLADRLPSKTFR